MSKPQRSTRQRRAIAHLLDLTPDFLSARQIHDALTQAGDEVGQATVYRALQAMVEAGEIDQLRSDSGESLYRRCATHLHHHHLVCRHCGRAVEIEGPRVETWADEVGARAGFSEISHTLELFGTCASCATTHSSESANPALTIPPSDQR